MHNSSSRQRMLAALSNQAAERPPCSFMLYNALKSASRDYFDFVEKQLELGLDACVEIPPRPPVVANDWYNLHGLPVSYDPRVTVEEWVEQRPGERWPLMIKEYRTPAGVLRAEVNQDEEWRWGNHVPFLDDFLESRSRRFIVQSPDDLPALQYLLQPPSTAEKAAFRAEAQPCIELAQKHDLLLTGGWGVGADMLGWIFGLQNMIFAAHDQPEFLRELLTMVSTWNRTRMQVILDAGVDLYIKRAWYENCGFWSPPAHRKFLADLIEEDAALAHSQGAKLGYIITSHAMPLLDILAASGVDVLIGVDPLQWDMQIARRKLGGKVCLWGGVNGHLSVERGSPQEVRAEVRQALQILAPGGGFILSPVDNVRQDTPTSRANVHALIDEWKGMAG